LNSFFKRNFSFVKAEMSGAGAADVLKELARRWRESGGSIEDE
jgi:hypothetical protein